jgi:hypothetical protein
LNGLSGRHRKWPDLHPVSTASRRSDQGGGALLFRPDALQYVDARCVFIGFLSKAHPADLVRERRGHHKGRMTCQCCQGSKMPFRRRINRWPFGISKSTCSLDVSRPPQVLEAAWPPGILAIVPNDTTSRRMLNANDAVASCGDEMSAVSTHPRRTTIAIHRCPQRADRITGKSSPSRVCTRTTMQPLCRHAVAHHDR